MNLAEAVPKKPGTYNLIIEPGGRRVAIRVPPGYTDSRPTPLILGLHWGGPVDPSTAMSFLAGLLLPALGELQTLIIAPLRTGEDWTHPQSEAQVLQWLDWADSEYSIDRNKVLIAGYSLGGIGAWFVAGRHQERFAGALSISAIPPLEAAHCNWTIPVCAIHSRQDEFFSFEDTEKAIQELSKKGARVHLIAVEGVTHFETEGFLPALKKALPWIRQAWSGS